MAIPPHLPGLSLHRANVRGLQPLGAGGDVEADPLTFLQGLKTLFLDRGEMSEEILAAVFWRDEAEALCIVEPLWSTVADKAPTRRALSYWITSFARNSNVCGIVSPSAFAVLPLMINSNFVGCSTGKSPGFAPRRTLLTIAATRR